jgi:hypothetical protein
MVSFLYQPTGYYRLFSSMLLKSLAYFGFKAILYALLFEALSFSEDDAKIVFERVLPAVAFLPLLGGLLADTVLRHKNVLALACIVMAGGGFCMAIAAFIASQPVFLAGLILLLLGDALFVPSFYSKLFELYPHRSDPGMLSGFLFLVVAGQLGAFAAPLVCGLIWKFAGIASACIAIGSVHGARLVYHCKGPDGFRERGGGSANRESLENRFCHAWCSCDPFCVHGILSKIIRRGARRGQQFIPSGRPGANNGCCIWDSHALGLSSKEGEGHANHWGIVLGHFSPNIGDGCYVSFGEKYRCSFGCEIVRSIVLCIGREHGSSTIGDGGGD